MVPLFPCFEIGWRFGTTGRLAERRGLIMFCGMKGCARETMEANHQRLLSLLVAKYCNVVSVLVAMS